MTTKNSNFEFHLINKIPKLAWCARMQKDWSSIKVLHGPWVEISEGNFIEGAWESVFARKEFDQACLLMGSGGKLTPTGVVFSSPCHTLEALFSVDLGTELLVSNTLVFLLVQSGLNLDSGYRYYTSDHKTIVRGYKDYIKAIPTAEGITVQKHYYCNLEIAPNLCVSILNKATPPDFNDFKSYENFLKNGIKALVANANANDRKIKYKLVTSISTGYDSPACAALAAQAGCQEALTFREASGDRFSDDSGKKIASLLGLRIKEFSTREYEHRRDIPEAEFVACGNAGEINFVAMEEELKQTLFITGFHGDKVWDPYNKKCGPYIIRGDASSSSLGEFRLRIGFIHVPLPFFGSVAHEIINKISLSAEMEPWRLNNDYDRPIPRRILEEIGIDRKLFAQTKKVTSIWWELLPQKSGSIELYEQYLQAHSKLSDGIRDLIQHCTRRWFQFSRLLNRLLRKLRIPISLPDPFASRFSEPVYGTKLVPWGITVIKNRYEF